MTHCLWKPWTVYFNPRRIFSLLLFIVSRAKLATLLNPSSSLKALECNAEGVPDRFAFNNLIYLLDDIERSNLERFCVGTIMTEEQLQSFITKIPSMRVTT